MYKVSSKVLVNKIILIPARDTSAETSAKLIYEHYVLRFGAFKYFISDRGTS
jgi:hypothetical protein